MTQSATAPLRLEEPDLPRYQAYGPEQLDAIAQRYPLPVDAEVLRALAWVVPFRVNRYVLDELIDWSRVPDDPIYRLVFPQAGAVPADDLAHVLDLMRAGATRAELIAAARVIQARLNPHPAGQWDHNRPALDDGEPSYGMQHKYAETLLVFPSGGQTCHAYCSYCFRWPQFVGDPAFRFAESDPAVVTRYLRAHPGITDVVFTGGDPLIMRTATLARYVEPLLSPDLESVRTIRVGTKSLAYWPHRFAGDRDADELLRLVERVVAAGKQLVVMAHYSHRRELGPAPAREAVSRLLAAGARIYCQAPLIRGVNDSAGAWSELWSEELALGCTPYYMFVERDTGPRWLYELPLERVHAIFRGAYATLPGLARTVRGPVMSITPGKVALDGIADIGGERAFALRFLNARRPEWVGRPFFARFDPRATWFSDLEPVGGARSFFFEDEGGSR